MSVNIYPDMNGQNANLRRDLNAALAILIHDHCVSSANIAIPLTGDNVAVNALGQTGEYHRVHVARFVVERDEPSDTATEGDLIAVVVPPGDARRRSDDVAEFDHFADLRPAVLANPAVSAQPSVGVDAWGDNVEVLIGRWT